MPDERKALLATKPCGCLAMAVALEAITPEEAKDLKDDIYDCSMGGCTIRTVTADVVRNTPMGCPKCEPKKAQRELTLDTKGREGNEQIGTF